MKSVIEVIGLGASDMEQLPLGIYRKLLQENQSIFVRTIDHPVVQSLQAEGVSFLSFDDIYEKHEQFEQVYEEIVERLITEGKKQAKVVYAVPGHPMLAERTVQLLLENKEIDTKIIGGQSYLDATFTALQIDPIEGFQFIDGTSFTRDQLDYRHHLLFCQVYDRFLASEVKLTLLEDLPENHPVTVVEAVGSKDEKLTTIPLVELDQTVELSNLTSVYVKPTDKEQLNHHFFRLREVIAKLRSPDGCPWDKKQTHQSLRKYLIEETYEFIEAVDNLDDVAMVEEIGDVLLQVMLHSQIGEDEGFFTIDDVIKTLTDKMVRRHPHVFDTVKVNDKHDVVKNWNEIKKEEKPTQETALLDQINPSQPQLLIAEEIQKKAATVGFDWDDVFPIFEKIKEEMDEVWQAIEEEPNKLEGEIGDLLFAVVNLARYYKINPELAIFQTNNKFRTRFQYIEMKVKESDRSLEEMSLDELDHLWNEAKQIEDK
ncbi:nucleoside triphosphate pyrophosphohydrolase [Aquibacillus salsiterrae]|uniref:Nucleoside triphosphate pyrophosphohydrolase n=1 Tax=Aquibacillus salsiterrae TaxID=2950439 RepID=A0A9X4AH36_9BACI|nr:nucleoside triphosphate pyrophosphohydrolase [Aquibacillus salsiterrae]MDC3417925.1 nucleoside triphosphate pyrophosphohydrolase [Aquibacillus salsiterrae]